MSDPKPYTALDEHLQLVEVLSEEFHTQALIASSDPEGAWMEFAEFFYRDLLAYRFSMLNEDWLAARLWGALRGHQAAFDAVLDMTSVLAQVASFQNGGWEAAVAGVTDAMAVHAVNRKTNFMDAEELSDFCSPTTAKEILAGNPWLVTLYLLRLTPAYRDGLNAMLNPPDKKQAPANAN